MLDGINIKDITLKSLVGYIGVVSQDTYLFHTSIADNLRYSQPDATIDELERACRSARIHDTIAALPAGYDTVVGERGHRFSGGEKQRLAIARLLLKNPRVVILDEATAHLDSTTEALVHEALTTALTGRTAIVIAHRLSTVVRADQILVLDNGHITQRGTHSELIKQDGLYRELFHAQSVHNGPSPTHADKPLANHRPTNRNGVEE